MSKKRKDPILHRVVRWLFPKLERFAPPLATRLFVQMFFTPLQYGFPEKELEWVNKSDRFTVSVNDKKVQCYSWGNPEHPIVMFVHGWAGRATQFRYFFPVFIEAGFRVVAFDGPAHGKSEGIRTNHIEFGHVLRELFKKTGNPKAIIAHSFGGVASLYAATTDLPIKKLINIGVPVIPDKVIETFLQAVNGKWQTAEKFKAHLLKKYNRSFDESSAQYFIQHIKSPIDLMLVHDEDDKDVPIEHAGEMIKLYPQAIMYKTTGLGHIRILKDESVIKDCLKFVQSV